MTPFDLILGEGGPRLLLAAIALAAVLTLIAAGLEIMLDRAGGADPAGTPDRLDRHSAALVLFAGVPALVIAAIGAFGLTLALGGNPEESGLPLLLPLLLDLCVVIAILGCGVGSPLTQHWGLAIAAFAFGVSAIFPLLFMAHALPFGDDGGLAYPERFVFALVIALILLTAVLAASALVALGVYAVRTFRLLRLRMATGAPARLTFIDRGRGR